MLTIAHRGHHRDHPENTLAAFQAAVDLGADGIETDIRLTADGQTILYHDRIAPDGQDVAAVARSELERLAGYAVPTLDEALERFPTPLWVLEIKTPAAIEATLESLSRYSGSRRLLVISFWHNAVEQVGRRFEVECGLLICHRPMSAGDLVPRPSGAGPRISTLVWNKEFLDPEVLAEARTAGLKNFVWGLETPADHKRAADWGLDAVITDRPDWMGLRG